ncbi:hypothetical protein [Zunongwangia sp. H14]|uniref:hypothetical protein n=1 Tax=Zunongwangia sp. H14 TaxID=3240792 RepID=UPI00356A7166
MKSYQKHRKGYRKRSRRTKKTTTSISLKDKLIAIIAFVGVFLLAAYLAVIMAIN